MTPSSTSGMHVKYSTIFLLTVVLLAAALFSGLHTLKLRQLRNEAMTVAEQVISFREWVGGTGVVWVDHLAERFPDFLGERKLGDGRLYSKNPALATRELSLIVSKSHSRATFRVTSDNCRNQKNTPDQFESEAIQALKADSLKAYADVLENGTYRYAQPLYITKTCLKCHGKPEDAPPDVLSKYGPDKAFGYKEGDIRGIVSVTLPDVSCWEIVNALVNPCSVGLTLCALALNLFFLQRLLSRRRQHLAETGGYPFLSQQEKTAARQDPPAA